MHHRRAFQLCCCRALFGLALLTLFPLASYAEELFDEQLRSPHTIQTVPTKAITSELSTPESLQIEIVGTQRVSQDYIRDRLQQTQQPIDLQLLEDQLRLLQADPLFASIEAVLRPGNQPGQMTLSVQVEEANPLTANLSLDNYSPPSVGGERFGARVSYQNLTGNGDTLAVDYKRTFTGGANQLDISYRTPLNPLNGSLQVRYGTSDYRITDPSFIAFGINGSQSVYDLTYRQPMLRTPREELALSLGLTHQSGQSFIFNNIPMPFGIGPDANGVSRTSVVKLGQEYTVRDPAGGWGVRSQLNLGTGLFSATQNPDPIPDGQFFSWLGQIQRVQVLGSDNLLIAAADLQLSANSLLPSEQFTLGGGQSIRGYRQNARSGDNGFRLSIEDRITLSRSASGASDLQLAPFVDLGSVWNSGGNPNLLPDQTWLGSAGLGILWQPTPGLGLRLDYAIPFTNLTDKGTNIQDAGLHFSLNARF